GAVGAEPVPGLIVVVVGQRLPVGVEVLVDPVAVVPGDLVDDRRRDRQGAVEPDVVPGDIVQHQEGLDAVHVHVPAAVVLGLGEGLVPVVTAHALLVGPEVLLDHLDDQFQQFLGAGDLRGGGARGGQRHEGVGIGLLVPLEDGGGVVGDHRVPAAVLSVAGDAVQQGVDAGPGEGAGTGTTHQRGDGVDVDLAGGDPQM